MDLGLHLDQHTGGRPACPQNLTNRVAMVSKPSTASGEPSAMGASSVMIRPSRKASNEPKCSSTAAPSSPSGTRAATDALRAQPGVDGVTAFREGRIITLEAPFALGSPLAVDGLETMARDLAGFR